MRVWGSYEIVRNMFLPSLAGAHFRAGLAAHRSALLFKVLAAPSGSSRSGGATSLKLDLSASKGAFQIVVSCLLQQLGVLQSLYEFELLLLHALDHGLVLDSLALLVEHLVFDLLLCAHLALLELALPLAHGLHLLSLDHLLQTVVLYLLLVLLDLQEVLLLPLLLLHVVDVPLDLILKVALGRIHVRPHLLLQVPVLHLAEGLLLFLLPLSLSTLGGLLEVALASTEDVIGAFLGLVEFLPGLLTVVSGTLTFCSSCLRRAMRFERSLWSSSALLRAIFAAISFLCSVSSSSSS